MDTSEPSAQTSTQAPDSAERKTAAPIDVQQLADRVYRLMKSELRLASARGERRIDPRKR